MTEIPLPDIALTTLDGRPTTLAELADGAALVVNVASRCGLTPQYTALEQLAKDYAERGLTVPRLSLRRPRLRLRRASA